MPQITLASWNVNSLKVRLPQLLDWLDATKTDAVVLQETKLTDDVFPAGMITASGYDVVFTGQKTYNGVALLTRRETMEAPQACDLNIPGYPDEQKRLVAATILPKGSDRAQALRFVGAYFPNGMTPGSWKYLYKLDWLRALTRYLGETLRTSPRLVLGGDFNIAPTDLDVWDPKGWADGVLVSPPERAAFRHLLDLGLTDSFRAFHPTDVAYSWWDYRFKAYENNHGLRIDHLLVSEALKPSMTDATIDESPRGNLQPSDHAPVTVTLNI